MGDINDWTVDDLQFYLRKYRFNEDCLSFFRDNEIDGFTLNLMTEIPEFFASKIGYRLKFKFMFLALTGRDIDTGTITNGYMSISDSSLASKALCMPLPMRQSDIRLNLAILNGGSEKENLASSHNGFCFDSLNKNEDSSQFNSNRSAVKNEDQLAKLNSYSTENKVGANDYEVFSDNGYNKYDDNMNDMGSNSNCDMESSDEDDDEDYESILCDGTIELPKFHDRIEQELINGDVGKILKTFVREVADFYVKNNIPINKSKHYKQIAIALFKKYENLKRYFDKEVKLLNYTNNFKSNGSQNGYKTIQAYRQLTKRLAHRVRNLRFKYKTSKFSGGQLKAQQSPPLSN